MNNYYFIPIEKDETGYYQASYVDFDNIEYYEYEKYYPKIIKKFKTENAVVKLKTGKFTTNIFKPIDDKIKIYYCLVDKENYPPDGQRVDVSQEQIEKVQNEILKEIGKSEGVFPENSIDILSQFVTPKYKFEDEDNINYYSLSNFKKDTIILGPPGCGKTTLLRWMTLDLLKYNHDSDNDLNELPVYIQLRNYNFSDDTFDQFINNSIINTLGKYNFPEEDKYISSGKLTLLLDGADEIDFEKFLNFPKYLYEYKEKFPFISFIISSRPDKSFEKLSTFRRCWIQPFDIQQIKELSYNRMPENDKWKDYLSVVNSAPEIISLLKNPLMLSLSHFLFQSKSIFPINTAQLLKEFVTALTYTWDSQRKIERKLNLKSVNPNEIINVLGKLALILTEEKKSRINPNLIYSNFSSFNTLDSFSEFLKYIEFSTGIIKFLDNELFFTHKSMQDFFCSNFLVEGVQEIHEKVFFEKDWSFILKIISGLVSDPSYLIKQIISSGKLANYDKINNTLFIFSESSSLSKEDLQNSFTLLEEYILNFEKLNKISLDNIHSEQKQVLLKKGLEQKGFREVIVLIKVMANLRFTKYEYDFNGYLKRSKSNILQALCPLLVNHGDIVIKQTKDNIIIANENVKVSNR